MKIIFTEDSNLKELADEELIAENVQEEYVDDIVAFLNSKIDSWSAFTFKAKDDDYTLLKQFEEEAQKGR